MWDHNSIKVVKEDSRKSRHDALLGGVFFSGVVLTLALLIGLTVMQGSGTAQAQNIHCGNFAGVYSCTQQ